MPNILCTAMVAQSAPDSRYEGTTLEYGYPSIQVPGIQVALAAPGQIPFFTGTTALFGPGGILAPFTYDWPTPADLGAADAALKIYPPGDTGFANFQSNGLAVPLPSAATPTLSVPAPSLTVEAPGLSDLVLMHVVLTCPNGVKVSGTIEVPSIGLAGLLFPYPVTPGPTVFRDDGGNPITDITAYFASANYQSRLYEVGGSTEPGITLAFLLAEDFNWGGPVANSSGLSAVNIIRPDADRLPVAPKGGTLATSIGLQFSPDAAQSFTSVPVANTSGYGNPSLVIGASSNSRTLVADNGNGLITVTQTATAGEQTSQWPAPTAIAELSGSMPACAQHPTDTDRVAMAYVQAPTPVGWLAAAISYDRGQTWATKGNIASVDFTQTGRAGICWFGELLFVFFASGSNLAAYSSPDLETWKALPAIAAGGPYQQVSAACHDGTLFVGAFDGTNNHLWRSGDAGNTWTEMTAPPTGDPQAGIGPWPTSGRLYWGTAWHSDDGAMTWAKN